jgi:IS30 family transposase
MKKNKKLSRAERFEIAILLGRAYSFRAIALAMGRSPNTISYEVRENSVNGVYNPRKAHAKARVRRRNAKFQWKKIREDDDLRAYIIAGLEKHWNPDEISGAMKREKQPFSASKTAIYEWLYSASGQPYCKYLYSNQYRKKPRKAKARREMIPDRIGIEKRPREAALRLEAGHFEGDTIVSRRGGTGGLSVLSERRTRLVRIKKLHSLSPKENLHALRVMKQNIRMKTLTFDNGIENKQHTRLSVATFFCDPYSSWQKGGVENANRMIRRYFPKGTDFARISEKAIRRVERLINEKPRKILGYRTAIEVAVEEGVLLRKSKPVNSVRGPN